MGVDDEGVQHFAESDIHGAAQRHHRGKADADKRREIEHGRAHRARLRNECEAAGARDRGTDRRIQSDIGAHDAERMRSDHPDAARDRDGPQRALPAQRFVAFLRRRGKHDDRLDAGARRILEHADNRRRRRRDQCEIDRLRDRGQRRVRAPGQHAPMLGIDDIERALEAAADEILEDDPAVGTRLAGGADDRDRSRRQQRAEIG